MLWLPLVKRFAQYGTEYTYLSTVYLTGLGCPAPGRAHRELTRQYVCT